MCIRDRDTAGKARFRNFVKISEGKYRLMTDEEYAVKLRAETHIDELSQVSKRGKKIVPDSKNPVSYTHLDVYKRQI